MADIVQGTSEEAVSREPSPNTPERPLIRIVLADSQAIYRVGMRKVFALEDDLRVVAQVDRIENLQAALERHPADVLLLESNLITGVANAIPEIMRVAPDIKIIVQTAGADEANTVELYRRGVRGIIPRSISPRLACQVCTQDRRRRDLDRQSIGELGHRSLPVASDRNHESEVTAPAVSERAFHHCLYHPGQAK